MLKSLITSGPYKPLAIRHEQHVSGRPLPLDSLDSLLGTCYSPQGLSASTRSHSLGPAVAAGVQGTEQRGRAVGLPQLGGLHVAKRLVQPFGPVEDRQTLQESRVGKSGVVSGKKPSLQRPILKFSVASLQTDVDNRLIGSAQLLVYCWVVQGERMDHKLAAF